MTHAIVNGQAVEALVAINGVSGVSGGYLVEPLAADALARIVLDEEVPDAARDARRGAFLKRVWSKLSQPFLGLPPDVTDPTDVRQTGWGVVFDVALPDEVRDALSPLLEHRRRQVGDAARFKVLDFEEGDSWSEWLALHDTAPGTVEPTRVPYYLLIVGDPARIPFGFAHQLDIEYAVGWLHFETAVEYARYAESVVRYETAAMPARAREIAFFAPRHDTDRATTLSADHLVLPLVQGLAGVAESPPVPPVAEPRGFRTVARIGDAATKQALGDLLRAAPALLFSASHGVGWPKDHPRQLAEQGALLCQDWAGPGHIDAAHYFSARDVPADADLSGLIAFHFACYGAGTPSHDRYLHLPGQPPAAIAPHAFLAALPRRLLSHERGAALAVIAHVERAWGYSIATTSAGAQIAPFRNALTRLMLGQPVGHALKDFNERYAALSTALSALLESASFGRQVPPAELAAAWVQRNDAEGYLVLGDPAVRLRAPELH